MDTSVKFIYNNCEYSGEIIANKERQPYFYWFVTNDPELVKMVGGEVGFVEKYGKLIYAKPVKAQPDKHQELIDLIATVIESHIPNSN